MVSKVEDLILKSLSATDREILLDYVSQQLELATNKIVQDGLKDIVKHIKQGWTDIEDSPYALSVKYFEKNIFTFTPFQNRVAYLCEVFDKVKNIFDWEIYPFLFAAPPAAEDKTLLTLVGKVLNSFRDMLGEGINFKGLPNNDSYYESHKRDYEIVVEVHKEFVRRDCQLLRELFEEL
jgi:hypothetical protein